MSQGPSFGDAGGFDPLPEAKPRAHPRILMRLIYGSVAVGTGAMMATAAVTPAHIAVRHNATHAVADSSNPSPDIYFHT